MKKLKRENSFIILEYKFAFEELIQIKKEYDEGTADLNFRLSFFQKRIPKTQFKNERMSESQKFNSIFFNNQEQEATIKLHTDNDINDKENKVNQKCKWARILYKKIVL